MVNKKCIFLGLLLFVIVFAVYAALISAATLQTNEQLMEKPTIPEVEDNICGNETSNNGTQTNMLGIHSIGSFEQIQNPDIARKYGISGYLEVNTVPDTPKALHIEKGDAASVTILLHFVSHVSSLTETKVNVTPDSDSGLKIEQYYQGGSISVNSLVAFYPTGNITIKAGDTVSVRLTVRIPEDFPTIGLPIPLRAVGITADVPIIDMMDVVIDV